MRPSQPHHAVTSYHREPGGLRRLDFFVDKITQHLGDRNPSDYKILDVGCGNGNISIPLAVMGFDIMGIDLSDAAIKASVQTAEETGVRSTFLVGGIDAIADGKFDAIICSEVLEHQAEPQKFLMTLRGKLTSNGVLLLSVPNGQSLEERLRRVLNSSSEGQKVKSWVKRLLGAQTIQSMSQNPHVCFFSYKQLTSLLRKAGFWIAYSDNAAVWFKEFFYLIGRAWMKRGSNVFHWLDKTDNRLADYWPRFSADGWLITAKRETHFILSSSGESDETRGSSKNNQNKFILLDPRIREDDKGGLRSVRVVQLIPTLGVGGAERIVMQLVEGLPARGIDVVTIAHMQGGAMEKIFSENNLPLVILSRTGFLKRWRNFWTLRRELIDLKPDIVHTHLFGSDFWGRLAARFAGVRQIVTTEHNTNVEFGLLRTTALRLTKNLATKHVAISMQVKDYLRKTIGVAEKEIEVIYNGTDLRRVKRRSGSLLQDVPKFIFVGRLEEQKNPVMLLKVLAAVKRPWRLSVVGAGSLEARLKSLAEELKITPRVDFLGLRDDVPELLARHDFFLFPSRWEGFGLAVLEAAVAGLPVIASDLPVLHEILKDDQATFLPADDAKAWSSAIESALTDSVPFFAKAARAASSDWSKFSQATMVGKYADVYCAIMYVDSNASHSVIPSAMPKLKA
ncbi:MAG: glycosyltransferase [Patescibacteria group bacterium]|nr:glycosyltransferase [Patescibacteria group bacterium]